MEGGKWIVGKMMIIMTSRRFWVGYLPTDG